MDSETAAHAHDPAALTQALQAAAPMNRTYRIRACNTEPATAGGAYLTNGFSGCTDSRDFAVTVSRRY